MGLNSFLLAFPVTESIKGKTEIKLLGSGTLPQMGSGREANPRTTVIIMSVNICTPPPPPQQLSDTLRPWNSVVVLALSLVLSHVSVAVNEIVFHLLPPDIDSKRTVLIKN